MKKPTPFGKYYLLERINVGGMAEVFRAKAFGVEGFERLVAVKRILPNIAEDKEFIKMFIEEAKLAVQLNHANIAQIFDLGVVDGAYYIALEHVHGRDLRGMFDRCRQLGEPMPVSQACFCVMKVCEGLDYAHNKRDQAGRELHLVHRDVSPQNVLVSFEGEVKLIDFGIAKAAGKGSKTQAGILKGKFGYMSPEQVRGIPIDRRSDVFSCGIVLYELLTGERLFVGESDFSTLEKVRNVEILPPSTYNRRIPDELERIVLKALAKDPDERYSNAIDLHDELQAFVYTAGEFYSRKDLAGWMKKTFGREIEEETAKLESYRQLKAPVAEPPPVVSRTASGTRPPTSANSPATAPMRKQTQSSPSLGGTKPPPPPPSTGRSSGQLPAISAAGAAPARSRDGGDLAWDDDELETQIYDNPEDDPKRRGSKSAALPLAAPQAAGSPLPSVPPGAPGQRAVSPDLSSLVSTAKGWDGAPGAAAKPPTVPPPTKSPTMPPATKSPTLPPPNRSTTMPPLNGANGTATLLPTGANGAAVAPLPSLAAGYPANISGPRETSAPMRLVSSHESEFDPMASFGQGLLARQAHKKSRGVVYVAVGGAAVAVLAVVIIVASTGGKKAAPTTETPAAGSAVAAAGGDQNTGFDLYVNPPGVTTWRLDGEARTDKLPSRIRGISPGSHAVAIDAPAGFMSQNQPITVEAGKAPKVEIVLQALDLAGAFESTPPGATVSLIYDGKRDALGSSPAHAKLDPRKQYQVLFEKAGYVSVNRPIVWTGAVEERLVVNLEKASTGAADPHPLDTHPVETHPADTHPIEHPIVHPADTHPAVVDHKVTQPAGHPTGPVTKPDGGAKPAGGDKVGDTKPAGGETKPAGGDAKPAGGDTKPAGDAKPAVVEAPKGNGVLLLGSKPPCDIFIDGSSTGLHTPQKDIKLAAGKHRVTLVNNEFGIKETFTVEIKPDQTEKQIKDYTDRIPK